MTTLANSVINFPLDLEHTIEPDDKMAEALARSQLKTTANQILFQFDGSIDKLRSFIDALTVLNEETEDAYQAYAVSLVKIKLTGDARLAITNETTLNEIITTLEQNIKSESKEVAEAKILNLRQGPKSPQTYIDELLALTKQLKLSYIAEGLAPATAKNFAETTAIKAMRSNVNNSEIKKTLAALTTTSLDVATAKYLECSTDSQNPHSVFHVRRQNFTKYKGRGGHNKNSRYNNQSNNDNRNRNNNGNNGNRGNYNTNRGNGNNNTNNNRSNTNANRSGNGNGVRVAHAENSAAQPQRGLDQV